MLSLAIVYHYAVIRPVARQCGSGDAQITAATEEPGPLIVGIESTDEEFFVNGA